MGLEVVGIPSARDAQVGTKSCGHTQLQGRLGNVGSRRLSWRKEGVSEPLADGRQPQWKSRDVFSRIPRFFLCQTTST